MKMRIRIVVVALVLVALALSGCAARLERIVSVVDNETGRAVTDGTFEFRHTPKLAPYAREMPSLVAHFDGRSRIKITLPLVHNWTRYVDQGGVSHGVTLKKEDIRAGGTFSLYNAPPNPEDQRIYKSKYELRIEIPEPEARGYRG